MMREPTIIAWDELRLAGEAVLKQHRARGRAGMDEILDWAMTLR